MSDTGYRLEVFPQRARRFARSRIRWHVRLVSIHGRRPILTSQGYEQHFNATRQALALSLALGLQFVEVDR